MTESSEVQDREWGRVERDRLAKIETLESLGIPAYAYRYDRTHSSHEALRLLGADHEEGPSVRVAGRMVSNRKMGKTTFAHLADRAGRIQIYFQLNVLGQEGYDRLGLLDLGDWIGVEGPLFRTRTGEVTIRVSSYELLAKTVRPLPLGKEEVDAETGERRVYSGFSDREMRYRQRYADLAVSPETREVFVTRAKVTRAMRGFLDDRGFLEVETPILQPLYGGAAAKPFVTHHNALDIPLYLRIADELYLKRLIVGGFERVYEIAKDFRNEGMDRFHNPEFTMLEFYAAYFNYQDVMGLTEELLQHVVRDATGGTKVPFGDATIDFEAPYRRLTMYDALEQIGDVDVTALPDDELRARVNRLGVADVESLGRGKLIDELFGQLVEPRLLQPTFITDYPREMSPLAKPKPGDPTLTERFELIVAGKELCNAYSELNDPFDQRQRLEAQAGLRELGDDEAHVLDEDFIRALEYGMPPTGGFGMGVDRLMMILTNQASIRDVILFPTMRPEG
jgi:lysyl-tRNA synthetase, class II